MKKFATCCAGALASVVLAPSLAAAATVSATRAPFCATMAGFCDGLQTFAFTFAVPKLAASGATVTIEAFGDFGASHEAFSVSVESFSLGTLLNNDETDDLFDGIHLDAGDRYDEFGIGAVSGTAFVPLGALAPLIADGELSVLFTPFSSRIDDLTYIYGTEEFISLQISFDEPSQVPLPAGGPLLALAGLGLGALRLRRSGAA